MPTQLDQHRTVPSIARETGYPDWLVRRVVDALDIATRAGLYRLVPADKVEIVKAELARRGKRRDAREVASA
jgi:hypothetical protein